MENVWLSMVKLDKSFFKFGMVLIDVLSGILINWKIFNKWIKSYHNFNSMKSFRFKTLNTTKFNFIICSLYLLQIVFL